MVWSIEVRFLLRSCLFGHSTIFGILYSNSTKVFCTFPHYPHKKCKYNKCEFFYYVLGIMVIFLKIIKNCTNFYTFIPFYIVNSNCGLDFLGSACRCAQAIYFGFPIVIPVTRNEQIRDARRLQSHAFQLSMPD